MAFDFVLIGSVMKRWALRFVVFAFVFPPQEVEAGEFALGAVFGDPTGISLRGGVTPKAHIQGVVGYGFFPGGGPTLAVDARFDLHDFLRKDTTIGLCLNMGPGISFHWYPNKYFVYDRKKKGEPDRFGWGLHAIFGLRLFWRTEPFELVFDFSPFGLVATTHAEVYYDFDVAFGFRYRF